MPTYITASVKVFSTEYRTLLTLQRGSYHKTHRFVRMQTAVFLVESTTRTLPSW